MIIDTAGRLAVDEQMMQEIVAIKQAINPDETLFMRRGREQGAEVKNGLEMLLLQAFAAWQIWNS